MPINYTQFAEKKKHNEDNYPKAEKGLKKLNKIIRLIKIILVVAIIATAIGLTERFITVPTEENSILSSVEQVFTDEDGSNIVSQTFGQITSGYNENLLIGEEQHTESESETVSEDDASNTGFIPGIIQMLKTVLSVISLVLYIIAGVMTGVLILKVLFYMLNVLRRWRQFERRVLFNDLRARALKLKILRTTGIKKRGREAKRKAKNKDGIRSTSEVVEIEKYQELAKLQVFINTRNSLEIEGTIDTQFRMVYEIPDDASVAESMKKDIEHMNEQGTKLMRGKVKFGKFFVSDDYNSMVSRAWLREDDKYAVDDESEIKRQFEKVETESDYTFDLSLFEDRQEAVNTAQQGAEQWARRSSKSLTSFLNTSKIYATYKTVIVGGANARYQYELAEDTDLPNFEKIGKGLDSMFNVNGAQAEISANMMFITVPLPKAYRVPINTATLYRDAFG